MITNKELADLIFPDVTITVDDLEEKYPKRQLPLGAEVTRFAPSPTGFLHTGSLFVSMICRKVATQSHGVFYVRLEDTDTKREIKGSGEQLISQLSDFGIVPDEGYFGDRELGSYGPYRQSNRADIYKIVIKKLLEEGLAYPCFCSSEEIEMMRNVQEKNKLIPGYYGQYAKCRVLNNDERASRIKAGEKFVIRYKSGGNHLRKVKVHDLIRGDINIAENDIDVVIYKSDGLPTYHFAHVVDDHFMRTTTVIRGEEWIASLPIHVQMFASLGWEAPKYMHVPVIMKVDESGNKRKLSKRKDPEAAVSYFLEEGYPPEALIMYLMTIANSNFEEWIFSQKFSNMEDFTFTFEKVSNAGALFALDKMNFFAKEVLAKKSASKIVEMAKEYAEKYDQSLKALIKKDEQLFYNIMNIERDVEKPRKDYSHFKHLKEAISFFYDDLYKEEFDVSLFNPNMSKDVLSSLLLDLKASLPYGVTQEQWFAELKTVGERHNFASNKKAFKEEPGKYIGLVSDVAEVLRIAITTRKNSPNLYYVLSTLGKEVIDKRIDYVVSCF